MNKKDWNEGLNNIDPALVEEHIEEMEKIAAKSRKDRTAWIRYVSVAATVCLVFGVLVASLILNRADEPGAVPEKTEETTEETTQEQSCDTESSEVTTKEDYDTESSEITTEEGNRDTDSPSESETVGGVITDVTSESVSEAESEEDTTEDQSYDTESSEVTTEEVTSVEETVVETVTTAEVTSNEETTEAITDSNQCTVPFNTVLFQTPQESSSKFNISKASADFSEKIYVDETATSYITLDIFGNEYKLSYKESAQLPRSDMIVNTYQYFGDEDDFKILINAATGEIVEYIGVSYEHNCISEEDYLDCIKSLLPEKYSLDLYNSYKVYTHYYSFGENYMESKEIEGFKMCGENEQLGGHTFVFTQTIGNVSLANHVSVEFSHGSIYIELYDFGYDLDEASVFIESFEKVESQFKTYITSKAKEDYTVSNIENKSYQFFMKGGIPYIMITSKIEMYRGEDKSQTFSALLKTFTTFDMEY